MKVKSIAILFVALSLVACSVGDDRLTALTCAKQEVRRLLKAPNSADFPMISYRESVEELKNKHFRLRSYVDAENSFGAQIRTQFVCEMEVKDSTSCTTKCELE